MANFFVALYNLFPFVKYDGYWILASTLGITNLMEKAIILFISTIFNNNEVPSDIPRRKKIVLMTYGGIALLFRIVFWLFTIYSLIMIAVQAKLTSGIVVMIGTALIIVIFIIEFRFCREQVIKYKSGRKRILELLRV